MYQAGFSATSYRHYFFYYWIKAGIDRKSAQVVQGKRCIQSNRDKKIWNLFTTKVLFIVKVGVLFYFITLFSL